MERYRPFGQCPSPTLLEIQKANSFSPLYLFALRGKSELQHVARSRVAKTAFCKFPLYISVTSDKTILQGKEEADLFCGHEREIKI